MIAGERTGEKGHEPMGEVCIENRGVMRFEVVARGARAHSALAGASADLGERLLQARLALVDLFQRQLTLKAGDGWQSQYRFPFITVGLPGVYNITADRGVLGVEVRSIPQDDLNALAGAGARILRRRRAGAQGHGAGERHRLRPAEPVYAPAARCRV